MGWGTPADLDTLAKAMRRAPTEPEARVWRNLSNSQLGGFKFRRQANLGSRIADFFCPAIGLIVEIDGDTHDPEADAREDAVSRRQGFQVIRFTNADVMQNMKGVLMTLLAFARSLPPRTNWRIPHLNPSPEGEGLR
ncbi:endonuclease domain-containing protein [Sphingomonas sp. A2-49]|uniref:endonuclease domain-containing protein n=1 Tax=Sphingomonas sp. A2-49 TaxID=1391375 RepID=UPI0021CFF149|nr:endonuclease domain-containing protein [Sphingomonas sp. A2-49]MCU6455120.1 endonuclease domain-containing protein [Sphingomonas sp. A2-49]